MRRGMTLSGALFDLEIMADFIGMSIERVGATRGGELGKIEGSAPGGTGGPPAIAGGIFGMLGIELGKFLAGKKLLFDSPSLFFCSTMEMSAAMSLLSEIYGIWMSPSTSLIKLSDKGKIPLFFALLSTSPMSLAGSSSARSSISLSSESP